MGRALPGCKGHCGNIHGGFGSAAWGGGEGKGASMAQENLRCPGDPRHGAPRGSRALCAPQRHHSPSLPRCKAGHWDGRGLSAVVGPMRAAKVAPGEGMSSKKQEGGQGGGPCTDPSHIPLPALCRRFQPGPKLLLTHRAPPSTRPMELDVSQCPPPQCCLGGWGGGGHAEPPVPASR